MLKYFYKLTPIYIIIIKVSSPPSQWTFLEQPLASWYPRSLELLYDPGFPRTSTEPGYDSLTWATLHWILLRSMQLSGSAISLARYPPSVWLEKWCHWVKVPGLWCVFSINIYLFHYEVYNFQFLDKKIQEDRQNTKFTENPIILFIAYMKLFVVNLVSLPN